MHDYPVPYARAPQYGPSTSANVQNAPHPYSEGYGRPPPRTPNSPTDYSRYGGGRPTPPGYSHGAQPRRAPLELYDHELIVAQDFLTRLTPRPEKAWSRLRFVIIVQCSLLKQLCQTRTTGRTHRIKYLTEAEATEARNIAANPLVAAHRPLFEWFSHKLHIYVQEDTANSGIKDSINPKLLGPGQHGAVYLYPENMAPYSDKSVCVKLTTVQSDLFCLERQHMAWAREFCRKNMKDRATVPRLYTAKIGCNNLGQPVVHLMYMDVVKGVSLWNAVHAQSVKNTALCLGPKIAQAPKLEYLQHLCEQIFGMEWVTEDGRHMLWHLDANSANAWLQTTKDGRHIPCLLDWGSSLYIHLVEDKVKMIHLASPRDPLREPDWRYLEQFHKARVDKFELNIKLVLGRVSTKQDMKWIDPGRLTDKLENWIKQLSKAQGEAQFDIRPYLRTKIIPRRTAS